MPRGLIKLKTTVAKTLILLGFNLNGRRTVVKTEGPTTMLMRNIIKLSLVGVFCWLCDHYSETLASPKQFSWVSFVTILFALGAASQEWRSVSRVRFVI